MRCVFVSLLPRFYGRSSAQLIYFSWRSGKIQPISFYFSVAWAIAPYSSEKLGIKTGKWQWQTRPNISWFSETAIGRGESKLKIHGNTSTSREVSYRQNFHKQLAQISRNISRPTIFWRTHFALSMGQHAKTLGHNGNSLSLLLSSFCLVTDSQRTRDSKLMVGWLRLLSFRILISKLFHDLLHILMKCDFFCRSESK